MKRYFNAGFAGIGIGLLSSLLFSFIYGSGQYFPMNPYSTMGAYYLSQTNHVTIMLLAVVTWALVGVLFEVTGQIFNQNWSLLKASIVHFICSFLGLFLLGFLSGWFPMSLSAILSFMIIFIGIYVIVYIINYQIMKKNIHQINQKLQQKH